MMDVVVIDLPPAYGMLLSRKWAAGLGGYLMMDLSYLCVPNSDGALIRINKEPCYEKHLETFEEGIKNTYGEELLNNAKADIVEDEIEVWEYRHPENMFMAMEDSDSSFEENQIIELIRMTNLEMLRGECLEELEEFRRSENQPQSQDQNPTTGDVETDNSRHKGRIPQRVNEWFSLIDHNRERESQGLELIYPWANHPELASVVDIDDEVGSSRVPNIAGSFSHLSLEDGSLIQVHDNSLSWQEDALINDAPKRDFNLNNLAIFQTPSSTPNNALSAYPLIPNFLLPP